MAKKTSGDHNLDKLFQNIQNLDNQKQVSLAELLNEKFMQARTKFNSSDDMVDNYPDKIETEEDFIKIPDEEWDEYIRENSEFSSWEEMQKEAVVEYMRNKITEGLK